MNAAELVAALGGRWYGSYGTVRCPAHKDRNPSLSISGGDGKVLVKCHAGCSQAAVTDALLARGLWGKTSLGRQFRTGPRGQSSRQSKGANWTGPLDRRDEAKRTECALQMWHDAEPAAETAVETYLRARGIDFPVPPSLRFARVCRYTPSGISLPAMIAAVQAPDRRVCAIHRTYLDPRGERKAQVNAPKMALGPLGSGAVRLAAAGEELGIAEGIETGLSAMQLFGVPVWCALGSRLHQIELPETVKGVVVFADNGAAGRKAADKVADRFTAQGRVVTLRYPPEGDGDFNDTLRGRDG